MVEHDVLAAGNAPWSLAPREPSDDQLARMRELMSRGFETVEPPPIAGGRLVRVLPSWLPGRVRATGTALMRRRSRSVATRAQSQPHIRLHLGCGWVHKSGWVNIDLFLTKADLVWDLAHGIPFADDSVEAMFHEHLLEHLTLRQGFRLAQESLRVLKPGGIMRIGVPDAGACLASYAGLADPDWAESQPTGLLAVQALFYEHGHRSMYDAHTLTTLCRAAGFPSSSPRAFGDSDLDDVPDTESRKDGTLYVESVK